MRRPAKWLALLALLVFTECQCGRQEPKLLSAVQTGKPEKVKEALDQKADVNEKDEYGVTALHLAARAGNKDIAQLLIDKGADVNAKTIYGQTPLHRASGKSVAELLINKGADVNVPDSLSAMAPLHWAASRGHKEVAEVLLASKANAVAKDSYGSIPLHLAASSGQKDAAELLIEKAGNVNAKDNDEQTPLHYAAESGQAALVHVLLAKGADRAAKDKAGKTPEELAHGDAAKDAFMFTDVAKAIQAGDVEKVKALLEKMTDVKATGLNGTTLLHLSAAQGRSKIVELLIEKEANVNAKDGEEKTPLDLAKDGGTKSILKKHEAKTGQELKEEEEKEKAEEEAAKK